jgi:uncharacterized protein (TIGR04255 family)
MKLPISLQHEPLIDAVFEVRMGGMPHLSDILPGYLFSQLEPRPTIQRLPIADVPQAIRSADPNMAFAPVVRLDWREFMISFGDRNLVIGCTLPYPKWPRFKEVILDIVQKASSIAPAGNVERYSIKYVNIIQANVLSEQIRKIDMSIKVGEVQAISDNLSVQVQREEGDTLHILSVVTGAQANLQDGRVIEGTVLDIDSIRSVNFPDLASFRQGLESSIETLRLSNKKKFFSCLTSAAIEEMGPSYD